MYLLIEHLGFDHALTTLYNIKAAKKAFKDSVKSAKNHEFDYVEQFNTTLIGQDLHKHYQRPEVSKAQANKALLKLKEKQLSN